MKTKPDLQNKSKKKDIGMWIIYGFLVGTIAGITFGNLKSGMGVGICIGILIGVFANR